MSQLKWLSKATRLISIEKLLAERNDDKDMRVAITFDDGYANLVDVALPIMSDLDAVSTVFTNTGWIGAGSERRPSLPSLGHYPNELFMSWRDLQALLENGWSVGSHGIEHLDLTVADEDTARRELKESKDVIEKRTSISCTLFAYTWGRHSSKLRRLVAETGYRYAFSGRHGPVLPDSDPMAVPRINISNEFNLSDFQAIVSGDWDYLGWVQGLKGL